MWTNLGVNHAASSNALSGGGSSGGSVMVMTSRLVGVGRAFFLPSVNRDFDRHEDRGAQGPGARFLSE
jgi:hypothetical protein